MSFDSLLIHRVTIKRMATDGTLDDHGQPVTAEATVASDVPALVQPRTVDQLALASQAGVQIGKYVGFLRPLAGLAMDCWLEPTTAPAAIAGRRFDIVAMPDAAGRGHHLELGLEAVG